MYKENKDFIPILNDDVIWRYMDISKFVDLIETKELYFRRIDLYKDPFEGAVPQRNKERIIETGKKISKQDLGAGEAFLHAVPYILEQAKRCTFVNCWHINDSESQTMWDNYTEKPNGIVIKTDFKGLKDSFDRSVRDIFIGKVSYIEHEKYEILKSHLFASALYKGMSYEWERELRVAIRITENINCSILSLIPEGERVKINIEKLIKEIRVSPGMNPNQKREIDELLLQNNLIQSQNSALNIEQIR